MVWVAVEFPTRKYEPVAPQGRTPVEVVQMRAEMFRTPVAVIGTCTSFYDKMKMAGQLQPRSQPAITLETVQR